MNLKVCVLCLSLFVVLTLSIANLHARQNAKPLPDAERIIENYVRATGGETTIRKLTSRYMKGTVQNQTAGKMGTIETYAKAPNKSLTVTSSTELGTVKEGFDGSVAWTQSTKRIVREMTGEPVARRKRYLDFYLPIRLRENFPNIVLKGIEQVGNMETYHLELSAPGSGPEQWFFDIHTGLVVRKEIETVGPGGKVKWTFDYEDYREVDGVKLPFTVRLSGPTLEVTGYTEIKHNISIDDLKFQKPAP